MLQIATSPGTSFFTFFICLAATLSITAGDFSLTLREQNFDYKLFPKV
jgi:hypothetical protein